MFFVFLYKKRLSIFERRLSSGGELEELLCFLGADDFEWMDVGTLIVPGGVSKAGHLAARSEDEGVSREDGDEDGIECA